MKGTLNSLDVGSGLQNKNQNVTMRLTATETMTDAMVKDVVAESQVKVLLCCALEQGILQECLQIAIKSV